MLTATLAYLTLASGKLFLVGGGKTPDEVPKRFIEACGGPESLIIVMPLTSAEPDKTTSSLDFLKENGAKNLYHFNFAAPTDAQREELKSKLKDARGIWIPGGVQARFIERLGKAWVDAEIKPLLKRGVNFYGTSAGSMLCSDPMIEGPGTEPDTARTGPGIGLTKWLIDTHFNERKREPRLRFAMAQIKNSFGLGLNERDWVVIQDDKIIERHGNPVVIEGLTGQTARSLPERGRTSLYGRAQFRWR